MTPDEPIDGIWMSAASLSDEEVLRWVNEAVEGRQKIGGLSPFPMRPTPGYLSLGRRDIRASPPPVPEDAQWRAANRAYVEAQKKKDAKMAKRKKKIVERDALEKRRRKQKLEGLPVEASPSTLVEDSSGDDGGEVERGPLDRLPNIREMVLGASAGGPASQGGGGDSDSGQMSARPAAEADTPNTRALGKRAVSPLGSTAEVEQAAAGKKRQAEAPAFAPRKALKVGTGSIALGVVEVQELVAQVGATQAAVGREEEEEPTLHEATAPVAVEATVGAAETPSAMEATEGEVEVEAPTVAEALWTSGVEVVEIAVPGNFGARVVEARVSAARAADLEVETEASTWEAEVHPIPADNASRGKGVADAGAASAVEQPALASGEGSAALVRVRPEPYGWDHPRVWWRSQDDPKGEPIFALEDVAEGGRWDTLEQYRSLAERSLRTALSVVANDLPGELEARSFGKSLFLRRERGVWDELCWQRELLAHANELLSARSAEELEEELARVADERDASNSWAEEVRATAIATAGQLGVEQQAHELTKGALAEATKAAEASQGEALKWREKAEELEKEASRAAEASRVKVQRWKEKAKGLDDEVSRLIEASVALQTVLDHEIEEHERLREALHTSVKRALAVVSSHYAGVDVEGISDGYVLSKDAVEAEEELMKLEAAVEGPGTALAKLFEEEVVPASPSADAGDPTP
ncbi:uncharacterized protein [Miscanthus floridulus]|uniref:uncharacterized protein n=1 Tax=Miscanthus floridulus TaxID=154761 RepID=UPI0034587571